MRNPATPQADAAGIRRGVAWASASAVAYSVSSVLAKDLLDHLRPNDILFWRFLTAAVVLWVGLSVFSRRRQHSPWEVSGRAILVPLGVAFAYIAMLGAFALEHIDASLYIVLVYAYPAMVAVASPLLGHAISRRVWAAVAITTAGVALTANLSGHDRASVVGVVLVLVQAAAYAAYVHISARVVRPRTNGLVTMAWTLLGAALGMGVLALAFGLRTPSSAGVVAELVAYAIVPTIVSGACFYQALRTLPPAPVAVLATLEPVSTIVWAVLLLGESLSAAQVTGASLVLVGVVWSQASLAQ